VVNCDSNACAEAMVRPSAAVSSCFEPAISGDEVGRYSKYERRRIRFANSLDELA
jgi:hypothetical protein